MKYSGSGTPKEKKAAPAAPCHRLIFVQPGIVVRHRGVAVISKRLSTGLPTAAVGNRAAARVR